jgi:hypothetical protein
MLINDTFDVFLKTNGREIVDVKLVKRPSGLSVTDVVRVQYEPYGTRFIVRYLHLSDDDYVYSGSVFSPLAWLNNSIEDSNE